MSVRCHFRLCPAPGDACRANIRFDLPLIQQLGVDRNSFRLVPARLSLFSEWSDCPDECTVLEMIDFVAAGRPLDLAAAVKPVCLEARKLGPSHC